MALKILVTFKREEKWMYEEIIKHSAKGNFIKDIIKTELSKK